MRTIVATDNRLYSSELLISHSVGADQCCRGFPPSAAQANMVINNHAIIDIKNGLDEEKAIFVGYIAVFDICFPDLINASYFPVTSYPARPMRPTKALR